MKRNLLKSVAFIAFLLLIQGCMENLNLTGYTIQYPERDATYIGTVYNAPPAGASGTEQLAAEFVIKYAAPPSSQPDIVLNGNKISKYFIFGPKEARGDIEQFKQFFRHGKNTLSVAPTSFGPSMVFNLDARGPTIIITRGEVVSGGSAVEVEGYLRDFSVTDSVMDLDLVQVTGYQADGRLNRMVADQIQVAVDGEGRFCAVNVGSSNLVNGKCANGAAPSNAIALGSLLTAGAPLLYSFVARDIYGYETKKEFVADNNGVGDALPVENAVRVAIGDSFIESMRPIIASSLYTSLKDAPIDVPKSTFDANGVNPIAINLGLGDWDGYLNQFYMANGTPISGLSKTPGTGTALLNGLKIRNNNILDIDMVLTELLVDLTIDAGWLLGEIELTMYIQRMLVDTEATVQAVNKKVTVLLSEDNSNFDLQGIELTKTKVWGIELSGLANVIIPALEGVIGGMLPGILNPILEDNLQKLVFGGTVTQPDNQTEFDLLLNVAQLNTENYFGNDPSLPFDMKVALESVVDVRTPDPNVKPLLGPVFYDDPIDPDIMFNSLGDQGTNMTVAVNSNLINQSLAAMHATGVTFFTLHNGKTYYGAHPNTPAVDPAQEVSATLAKKGDTRTRLWPDMPPTIIFSEVVGSPGEGRAAIEFESATLYQDTLVENSSGQLVWRTDVALQVNFDLAVKINENDGVFTMGAAGPPVFKINQMTNNTAIQIPAILIQGVLDTAMLFGGDLLADQFIVLDLGTLAADTINGTEVRYLSDQDDYTITNDGCLSFDDEGNPITGPDVKADGGGDGYDLICEEINFVVTTNTAGVTGAKGSNLFFQMEARDPAIPPAPAIPRFDLDDDDVFDYQDNCSLPNTILAKAITNAGGLVGNIDENGDPVSGFEGAVKTQAELLLRTEYGSASPSAADQSWYNNKRVGDTPVTTPQWLPTLYSNRNQSNTDGDRVGDLCEEDPDRDSIWTDYADNPAANDNCPFTYNPDQADNYGDSNTGSGDVCNIRQTFVLLKNQVRSDRGQPACLTHFNFNTSNSYTALGWATCDQADPAQRFYFKENTAETPPANSAVAQLWQTEARNGFMIATEIDNGTSGATTPTFIGADDVMLTNHPNYKTANFNDWIFTGSGNQDWPWLIKSYKFYKRDGVSSNWCIFEKDIGRPDQDSNSCTTTNYGEGAQRFQILLGSQMAPWTGSYD